jgi:hypothetical protein
MGRDGEMGPVVTEESDGIRGWRPLLRFSWRYCPEFDRVFYCISLEFRHTLSHCKIELGPETLSFAVKTCHL